MKILIRNKATKQWQKIDPSEYVNEAQLEQLLADSPDLLPSDEDDPVVFFKRQVTLGQNTVDLLGVTGAGCITLVECKLDRNREARRMVIAQILEYAAQLWDMDYEEFEGLLSEGSDQSLPELLQKQLGPTWLEEPFIARVRRSLEQGEFRLAIAVNGVTPELKRILEYANHKGGFHIEALELQHFASSDEEVLVPELFGNVTTEPRRDGESRPTLPNRTLEEVYADAANPEAARRLRWIVEEWEAAGHEALPKTSGISMRTNIGGKLRWVWFGNLCRWLDAPRQPSTISAARSSHEY